MSIDPKSIIDMTENPVFWIIMAWVAREGYAAWKHRDQAHTAALKENSLEIVKLTVVMSEIRVKLESIDKVIALVPKIRQDLDIAHERIRALGPDKYCKPETQTT